MLLLKIAYKLRTTRHGRQQLTTPTTPTSTSTAASNVALNFHVAGAKRHCERVIY